MAARELSDISHLIVLRTEVHLLPKQRFNRQPWLTCLCVCVTITSDIINMILYILVAYLLVYKAYTHVATQWCPRYLCTQRFRVPLALCPLHPKI